MGRVRYDDENGTPPGVDDDCTTAYTFAPGGAWTKTLPPLFVAGTANSSASTSPYTCVAPFATLTVLVTAMLLPADSRK